MTEIERKKIIIPEICRVEGHSAVTVDIQDGKVINVELDVFEGTRFFERIVVGHRYDELPHITSRVCAICSTGHVLAAINAVERIFDFKASPITDLYRELMHLGMMIESHATHICALALPDFLGTPDLLDFATKHEREFEIWTRLRNLGSAIQATIGGRPFHPVNLHVGGLSRHPSAAELQPLLTALDENMERALHLCDLLAGLHLPVENTASPRFSCLVPFGTKYGFFGDQAISSDGWRASIDEYRQYINETVVPYSHAKRSLSKGKPFMVGSMARLHLFGERLGATARSIYENSPLSRGHTNTLLNNLAQSIEIVEAIERAKEIINELIALPVKTDFSGMDKVSPRSGKAAGAVECPRGTLYHFYELDEKGQVLSADMITPSAQNTARIELDIATVVEQQQGQDSLQANLETLVRAYDPCNTCATHMVQVRYT